MQKKYDVAIIGAGPAGNASALYLLQAGLKPIIIEKEDFPRYHVGESFTGECAARLRGLGLHEQMVAAGYPVKNGVKVYGTDGKNDFWVPVRKRDENHQLQDTQTWQVRRSTFDDLLLKTALERGADYYQASVLAPIQEAGKVVGVQTRNKVGEQQSIQASVTIDATGQNTFFASHTDLLSTKERGNYDKQVAIFSQVKGAIRGLETKGPGDTIIFYKEKHHWAWFIPIDDEHVSVGVVTPSEYFKSQPYSKDEFLKRELRTLNPQLSQRLPSIELEEPARAASNYSYHIEKFTGPGFLCVGDAHRFLDPIFSFGVQIALSEAEFAAQAIKKHLMNETTNSVKDDTVNPFIDYQNYVEGGQKIVQNLIDCFWEYPHAFLYFIKNRYTDGIIDIFSGRIYGKNKPEETIAALQNLLATANTTPMKGNA